MSGFDALGRDVAAAADSEGEPAVATALKALWVWAGYDAGTNPNHLWEVEYWKTGDGFTVAARVKDKDVWAPEPAPAPPASAEELVRSAATTDTTPNADTALTVATAPAETTVTPDSTVAPSDAAAS